MRKSKGVIQFLPLLIVAFLVVGLVALTSSANKVTDFFNKAAEGNVSFFRGNQPQGTPTSNISQASIEEWQTCVSTPGSKILQTYPGICISPDGKRVTEPTLDQATPAPIPSPSQIPTPTCVPRPSCLDATPACKIPEPVNECPRSTPTSNPSPVSWVGCIGTPGSIVLQTYPGICVYPDGRKVTEPIVVKLPTPSPIPTLVTLVPGNPPSQTNISFNSPVNSNQNVGQANSNSSLPDSNQNIRRGGSGGSWAECTSIPGAVILQTYPGICRYPDGRMATEPVSPTVTPIATPTSNGSWEECISTKGSKVLQTFPGICVYPDGRKVGQPIRPSVSSNTNYAAGTSTTNGVANIINRIFAFTGGFIQSLFAK